MAPTNKLEKLYQTVANCEELGLELPNGVLEQINGLEEQFIKDEVLPLIHDNIEPPLRRVQRPLVLVVEYDPSGALKVNLSRKVNIAAQISDAKEITPVNKPVGSDLPTPKPEPHIPSKKVENPTKGMRVTFADGTIIWHRAAINTFIEVLRKIGFEQISKIGIEHGGFNLVDKVKRQPMPGRIWQHECEGWYIYSNISNETKVIDLTRISDYFKLGLKIEECKPNK